MTTAEMTQETAKNCPHCNMAVEKSEGCNKMVCGHCNGKFCYKCGQARNASWSWL